MHSRAIIDQAQGVLVVQFRCTPEDASPHLVELSQHSNRKLRNPAADVVASAVRG
ncbi:ANTAR domain-containing protein [Kineococcus xinjiangensis]|uniref:ANTAR domain-containing protein n=1 Tax=Kineococcus xinjiangensis TaxID=512762 RepID=A0A2S6IVD8_9ACTN|nr:ANTAR domain-containing protein [Kineococcus xinjiangensis]PPK98327.1 ANTAR domain-containing protein [Kineococcus xinjiangensis]